MLVSSVGGLWARIFAYGIRKENSKNQKADRWGNRELIHLSARFVGSFKALRKGHQNTKQRLILTCFVCGLVRMCILRTLYLHIYSVIPHLTCPFGKWAAQETKAKPFRILCHPNCSRWKPYGDASHTSLGERTQWWLRAPVTVSCH